MTLTMTGNARPILWQGRTGISIVYPFLYPTFSNGTAYDASPYTVPSSFSTHVPSATLLNIANAGYDHIKLEVDIGPLLANLKAGNTSNFNTLLSQITSAASYILADPSNLKVVINCQLTGALTGYDPLTWLDNPNNGVNFTYMVSLITNLATAVAGLSYTRFALQVMGNCVPDISGSGYQYHWPSYLAKLYTAARTAAPSLTLILPADNFGSPTNLSTYSTTGYDKNVLWGFALSPVFSAQGLGLTSNNSANQFLLQFASANVKYITNLEWPPNSADIPLIQASVTAAVNADATVLSGNKASVIAATMNTVNTQVMTQNTAYIQSQISTATNWAVTNNAQVCCISFGVSRSGSTG